MTSVRAGDRGVPAPAPHAEELTAVLRIAVRVALAVAILAFIPGLLDPFTPVKAALLRVIGLPLLLAVGIDRLVAGRRAVDEAAREAAPARALDIAVGCWVLAVAVSTVFGISPRLSLMGEIEQREGLFTALALAGVYFAARHSHREAAHARGTISIFLAAAALAAAYAMLQRSRLDPLDWENAPLYTVGAASVVRVFGTLGNPILLGAVLAAALGAGFARAISPSPRSPWLLPALVLFAAATAATLSRGALLAAAVSVATAVALRLYVDGPGALKRIGITLAWVGVPAVVWTLVALREPLAARLVESSDLHSESLPARIEMARSALALWNAHPWFGAGADAFGLAFPSVQTADFWRNSWLGNPVHAHSVPLQVVATGGRIALVAGLAWLIALLANLAGLATRATSEGAEALLLDPRHAASSALTGLLAAGVVNPVGLAGAALFASLSALVAGASSWADPAPAAPSPATPRAYRAGLVPAGGLALVLAVLAGREWLALAAAGRAHGALVESTRTTEERRLALTGVAVAESRRAARLASGDDELWRLECDAMLARAAALEAPRDPRLADAAAAESLAATAESAARRALALEPSRASNVQRLANALASRGQLAASDSAFDRAARLAPYDALILVDRVSAEMRSGRATAALGSVRRIVTLYPEQATGHALEAGVWMYLGRVPEARDALDRALAARWEADSEARHRAAERARRALDEAGPAR